MTTRTLALLVVAASIVIAQAIGAAQQPVSDVQISIDKIEKNDSVRGTVSGLTTAGRDQLRVVVYVKTDKWYIHPFTQGGDGKSFASIDAHGRWTIGSEFRGLAASAVAALVVRGDTATPPQVFSVRDIPNIAITVRQLEGTREFGTI